MARKSGDFINFVLVLFLIILAGVIIVANILLYPVIVEASANLAKMIFDCLGINPH